MCLACNLTSDTQLLIKQLVIVDIEYEEILIIYL